MLFIDECLSSCVMSMVLFSLLYSNKHFFFCVGLPSKDRRYSLSPTTCPLSSTTSVLKIQAAGPVISVGQSHKEILPYLSFWHPPY